MDVLSSILSAPARCPKSIRTARAQISCSSLVSRSLDSSVSEKSSTLSFPLPSIVLPPPPIPCLSSSNLKSGSSSVNPKSPSSVGSDRRTSIQRELEEIDEKRKLLAKDLRKANRSGASSSRLASVLREMRDLNERELVLKDEMDGKKLINGRPKNLTDNDVKSIHPNNIANKKTKYNGIVAKTSRQDPASGACLRLPVDGRVGSHIENGNIINGQRDQKNHKRKGAANKNTICGIPQPSTNFSSSSKQLSSSPTFPLTLSDRLHKSQAPPLPAAIRDEKDRSSFVTNNATDFRSGEQVSRGKRRSSSVSSSTSISSSFPDSTPSMSVDVSSGSPFPSQSCERRNTNRYKAQSTQNSQDCERRDRRTFSASLSRTPSTASTLAGSPSRRSASSHSSSKQSSAKHDSKSTSSTLNRSRPSLNDSCNSISFLSHSSPKSSAINASDRTRAILETSRSIIHERWKKLNPNAFHLGAHGVIGDRRSDGYGGRNTAGTTSDIDQDKVNDRDDGGRYDDYDDEPDDDDLDFIDDDLGHGEVDWKEELRGITGYDPKLYAKGAFGEDAECEEASFDMITKEEKFSAMIAKKEDEEQLRLIQEEEKREMATKKGIKRGKRR